MASNQKKFHIFRNVMSLICLNFPNVIFKIAILGIQKEKTKIFACFLPSEYHIPGPEELAELAPATQAWGP